MGGRREQDLAKLIEEIGVTSLIKLVLAVVALLVFLVLISLTPGIDRLIPGLPITYAAIIGAFVTLVIVGVLLRIATTSRTVVKKFRTSVEGVTDQFAGIIFWTIVFVAVVIAYEGFGPALEPILVESELLWMYDATFFILGIISLAVIGFRVLYLLDPLSELIVRKLRANGSRKETVQTTLPIESYDSEDSYWP